MLYSTVAALALILNTILNWDALRNVRFRVGNQDKRLAYFRYGHFTLAANFYFLVAILWGILYEYRGIPGIFPFLYSATVFYFIFMLATMLTWARYIVALRSGGRKKIKYMTAAITSIVICVFTFLQVYYTYYPYYAMGLIVGICLVHTFIEAGEKEEKEIHDHIASTMAEDYEV
ncbi:MAG: hypothetical protein J6N21_00980, partial [Butyrivibrio sp.]|nr:hypothetical protein [Butyrivibrio sp.]